MMTLANTQNWMKALSHGVYALQRWCTTAAPVLLLVTGLAFTLGMPNLAHAAPTVALTAPTAASQFGANATINFTATATADAGQTITQVQFYRNTTLIGTDTTAPYNATWSTPTAGSYSFTAKATTSTNLTVTTATTSITVTAAPTVALSAPTSNTGFAAGSNITVSATATPSTGQTLTKVEFFAGTTLIGTDTTSPYSIVWTAAPASPTGSYSITAKATDNLAGTKTSTARTINVTTPPTVTLTAPAANAI